MLRKLRHLFKPEITVPSSASPDDLFRQASDLQEQGGSARRPSDCGAIWSLHPEHWESLTRSRRLRCKMASWKKRLFSTAESSTESQPARNPITKEPMLRTAWVAWKCARRLRSSNRPRSLSCSRAVQSRSRAGAARSAEEALDSYDRAIGLDPVDFLTHYNRGSVLRNSSASRRRSRATIKPSSSKLISLRHISTAATC